MVVVSCVRVYLFVCVRERERETVCVRACVCVRETEFAICV
jgi:hypothetical protein